MWKLHYPLRSCKKTSHSKAPSTPIRINLKKKKFFFFLIWSSVHTNPAFYLPKTELFENALPYVIRCLAIHGQAPDYICYLINVRNFSTYGLRSNSELLLVSPSTKTKKTLCDRAFTAAAPSLWNKLPSAIRDEENFKRFKSKLKTFLFRVAYNVNSF